MRVICLASSKGGVGKSSISANLAEAAGRLSKRQVAILDTDPQQTLAKWWGRRAADTPQFVKGDLAEIGATLDHLAERGFDLVIVDTPPSVVADIARVIAVSDLVLIPTRPSPLDLEAVTSTIDLVEGAGKPMVFVINGATYRARITIETAHQLSQHGTLAPTTIMHRVDFATSMIDGRTVCETEPHGKSAFEIEALWTYLARRLEKLPARRLGALT